MKSHYCRDCGWTFNAPPVLEARLAYACPECDSTRWCLIPSKCAGVRGDRDDFRKEVCAVTGKNGGRYFPQLARFPDDPTAVVSSVKEGIERGKRCGMRAERG